MINVDDLFDHTSFDVDRDAHIVLDAERCASCEARYCTTACPARCYAWSEKDRKITFVFAGCLECGTCFAVCDRQAFTRWRYPRGGFGVSYRMT
ncbi:MAG TPA: 4Fe-4S dicluster domain-containing protein [Anaeromyxobacter sp.]